MTAECSINFNKAASYLEYFFTLLAVLFYIYFLLYFDLTEFLIGRFTRFTVNIDCKYLFSRISKCRNVYCDNNYHIIVHIRQYVRSNRA